MQNQTVQTVKQFGTLTCLLLLTAFLILLEISFFIQCNQAYLFGFFEVSRQLHIPLAIVPGIIFFILVQFAIHLIFCLCAWLITLGVGKVFVVRQPIYLAIFIWCLFLLTALLANQVYFPNSKFADLINFFFSAKIAEIIFFFLLSLSTLTCVLALIPFLRTNPKKLTCGFVFLVVLLSITVLSKPKITPSLSSASIEKPNIIIIGVDSLRPDFLSFFGRDHQTQAIDNFLQKATVFVDAITPLSRTFPSWVTILTGKHPKEMNVRSNLASQENLDLSATLPALLRNNGYKTIFATDESRFSNIDFNFGFDEIIVPPMGLNDFLIGSLNDFPLSNLIVNTKIGRWLFPYSYANRGVAFTYDPNSFLELINEHLEATKPLFLAVHFCLPHFPYTWGHQASFKLNVLQRYQASVIAADRQIKDFFNLLQQRGILEQAIVVLVSDHGEAIELPGDRATEANLYLGGQAPPKFYPPSLEDEGFNQSAGHGTDVLGLTQYHSLLAFKSYGKDRMQPGFVTGGVSLAQIAPTLLELVNLHSNKMSAAPLSGYMKNIQNKKAKANDAHIFLESDFSPESIRTVYPQMDKVMLEGIQLFEVKPNTTRLVLKKEMEKMVIASKQYADLYGEWILALYPVDQNFCRPILVNLRTGFWTDRLNSNFAKHSPAQKMLKALQNFYGNEIKPFAKEYSHV